MSGRADVRQIPAACSPRVWTWMAPNADTNLIASWRIVSCQSNTPGEYSPEMSLPERISRRELLIGGIALIGAASQAPAQTSANQPSPAIDDFFRDVTADWVRHDPTLATRANYFTGDEQDQLARQLTPRTIEWRRDRIARARKVKGR